MTDQTIVRHYDSLPSDASHSTDPLEVWCETGDGHVYLRESSPHEAAMGKRMCSLEECLSREGWEPLPDLDGHEEVMAMVQE